MRPDIAPGGTFPDYQLPDHENVPCKLSELQGDDPLILTLARGHWDRQDAPAKNRPGMPKAV
jgi:peroxiredoxin